MPVYEYMCEECGPFTAMRPMAEYEKPCVCPSCTLDAPRVLLTAPRCVTAMPRLLPYLQIRQVTGFRLH